MLVRFVSNVVTMVMTFRSTFITLEMTAETRVKLTAHLFKLHLLLIHQYIHVAKRKSNFLLRYGLNSLFNYETICECPHKKGPCGQYEITYMAKKLSKLAKFQAQDERFRLKIKASGLILFLH